MRTVWQFGIYLIDSCVIASDVILHRALNNASDNGFVCMAVRLALKDRVWCGVRMLYPLVYFEFKPDTISNNFLRAHMPYLVASYKIKDLKKKNLIYLLYFSRIFCLNYAGMILFYIK